MKKFLSPIIVMLLAGATSLSAQDWQSWNSVGFDFSLGKKWTLETKELISLQPSDGWSVNFAQSSLGLHYRINRDFSVEAGDQLNVIPSSVRNVRNRVYARGTYTWRFSELLRSTHALQFELHDNNEIRYDARIIFINGISTRNRYTPLNIRPSASYWLYYNIGGDPVQYYNTDGTHAVSQSAIGFHRGRLYVTLNAALTDHIGVSAYFMHQQEFNLFTDDFHEINVVNPNTGNIARDFSNYNVFGLSLNFDIGN